MTLHVPLWMQPASGDPDVTYTGQELRQTLRGFLSALAGTRDTQGIDGGTSYHVVQRAAGANFSVDVAAGTAFVVGDDVGGQGTYLIWNDGTVNVATPSAPASGTRVHRLVLQVQDKLSNGVWVGYTAALTLLQDTGAGTPAEPNSALTLALISIAAGQASVLNANITDQRPVIGPDVQSYTPSWTGPVFNLGSGFTSLGAFIRQGKLCTAWALLTAGTGTSLGTGAIRCTLPVTASSAQDAIGTGLIRPNNGSKWSPLICRTGGPDTASVPVFQYGSSGALTGTVLDNPGNWGTPWVAGSQMSLQLTYITA